MGGMRNRHVYALDDERLTFFIKCTLGRRWMAQSEHHHMHKLPSLLITTEKKSMSSRDFLNARMVLNLDNAFHYALPRASSVHAHILPSSGDHDAHDEPGLLPICLSISSCNSKHG